MKKANGLRWKESRIRTVFRKNPKMLDLQFHKTQIIILIKRKGAIEEKVKEKLKTTMMPNRMMAGQSVKNDE